MLAKLSEALFVDTLRRYVGGLSEQQTGWLAGARDAIVGKSLGLLHSRVAHPWTIADLADEVGISRSALGTPSRQRATGCVRPPMSMPIVATRAPPSAEPQGVPALPVDVS